MKLLLLIGLCSFFKANTQSFDVDISKFLKHSDILRNPTNHTSEKEKPTPFQKPGILYLPQDNMPCFVPDTREITLMPNAWPQSDIGSEATIPNPKTKNKRNTSLKIKEN